MGIIKGAFGGKNKGEKVPREVPDPTAPLTIEEYQHLQKTNSEEVIAAMKVLLRGVPIGQVLQVVEHGIHSGARLPSPEELTAMITERAKNPMEVLVSVLGQLVCNTMGGRVSASVKIDGGVGSILLSIGGEEEPEPSAAA